jgi:hypothetical protein
VRQVPESVFEKSVVVRCGGGIAGGIIDSQSVKGADAVPRGTRGYEAGKKINDRKRFIVTDTLGRAVR